MEEAGSFQRGVVKHGPVLGLVLALAVPGLSFGASFSMLQESDAGASAGLEVYELSYGSLADVYSDTTTSEGYTGLDISNNFSIRGFAFGDDQFHVLAESNADASGGSEVYIASYDSLADLYVGNSAAGTYTAMNVNSDFSIGGFAHDGSMYYILLESDADAPAGSEVYLIRYTSLANVISNTQAGADYTSMGVHSTTSIKGFAHDGSQYYVVLETNDDAAGGSEVVILFYNSLADVYSDNIAGFGPTVMDVDPVWSIGGFAGGTPPFEDGFETGDASRWSLTVP